jgi:hypothetical protein
LVIRIFPGASAKIKFVVNGITIVVFEPFPKAEVLEKPHLFYYY